jgi:hypothetical protein
LGSRSASWRAHTASDSFAFWALANAFWLTELLREALTFPPATSSRNRCCARYEDCMVHIRTPAPRPRWGCIASRGAPRPNPFESPNTLTARRVFKHAVVLQGSQCGRTLPRGRSARPATPRRRPPPAGTCGERGGGDHRTAWQPLGLSGAHQAGGDQHGPLPRLGQRPGGRAAGRRPWPWLRLAPGGRPALGPHPPPAANHAGGHRRAPLPFAGASGRALRPHRCAHRPPPSRPPRCSPAPAVLASAPKRRSAGEKQQAWTRQENI